MMVEEEPLLSVTLGVSAVPFLSQNQMLLKVIRHEAISPTIWAVYLGASLGLAAVLWFAAVRRYHNERLAISG